MRFLRHYVVKPRSLQVIGWLSATVVTITIAVYLARHGSSGNGGSAKAEKMPLSSEGRVSKSASLMPLSASLKAFGIDSGQPTSAAMRGLEGALAKLNGLDADQLQAILERLSTTGKLTEEDKTEFKASIMLLALKWPEAAMEFMSDHPDNVFECGGVRLSMMACMSGVGSAKFCEWASEAKFGNKGTSRAMLDVAMIMLAEKAGGDPGVLRLLQSLNQRGEGCSTSSFFGRFAEIDSAKCLEYAAKLQLSKMDKAAVYGAIAESISSKDPVQAWKLLCDEEVIGQDSSTAKVFCALLNAQRQEAIIASGSLSSLAVAKILQSPDSSSLYEPENRSILLGMLRGMPATSEFTEHYRKIISAMIDRGWTTSEVLSAIPQNDRAGLTRTAFERIAERNPDAAVSAALGVSGEYKLEALRGVTKIVAAESFERALKIAQQASPGDQQDIYREIARTSAYQKPENAVKMLEDPVLSEKLGAGFRQELLDNTVRTWANQDLLAAQQWVAQLPATDASKGVKGLMTTWMKTDPVAASGWLATQPLGPAREAGAWVIINQIKDTDPDMAEQWRKTLPPSAK